MDAFKSRIAHLDAVDGCIHGLDLIVHDDFVADDELSVQPDELGWTDGRLEALLKNSSYMGRGRRDPIYFRGGAMFGNIDDAKNDYLMNPEMEYSLSTGHGGHEFGNTTHIPFGMVIPHWKDTRSFGQDIPMTLTAVTIILFWQELE